MICDQTLPIVKRSWPWSKAHEPENLIFRLRDNVPLFFRGRMEERNGVSLQSTAKKSCTSPQRKFPYTPHSRTRQDLKEQRPAKNYTKHTVLPVTEPICKETISVPIPHS